MTLLATLEDFFAARSEDMPPAEDHEAVMRAKLALEIASDVVRSYTGRDFDRTEGTVLVHGTGTDSILLPSPPIAEVLTVSERDWNGDLDEIDAADYRLQSDAGILRRIDGGVFTRGWLNIEVELVSGYDLPGVDEESGTQVPVLPKDLQGVVLSLASRLFAQDAGVGATVGTGELRSVQMGVYSETYSTAADVAGSVDAATGLTTLEASTLERYRLIRVA